MKIKISFDLHVVNYSLSIRLEEYGANKKKHRVPGHSRHGGGGWGQARVWHKGLRGPRGGGRSVSVKQQCGNRPRKEHRPWTRCVLARSHPAASGQCGDEASGRGSLLLSKEVRMELVQKVL